jgi:hypothetical protein
MKMARWSALLALVVSLFSAGCANDGAASNNDRQGGFYGSISGGGIRP